LSRNGRRPLPPTRPQPPIPGVAASRTSSGTPGSPCEDAQLRLDLVRPPPPRL